MLGLLLTSRIKKKKKNHFFLLPLHGLYSPVLIGSALCPEAQVTLAECRFALECNPHISFSKRKKETNSSSEQSSVVESSVWGRGRS